MSLRDIFNPKPNKFINLLVEEAKLTVSGLELLNVYLEQRDAKVARKISETEKEADETRRVLIEELSFHLSHPLIARIITPFRVRSTTFGYANTQVMKWKFWIVSRPPYAT